MALSVSWHKEGAFGSSLGDEKRRLWSPSILPRGPLEQHEDKRRK